jgi:hypothetical protein
MARLYLISTLEFTGKWLADVLRFTFTKSRLRTRYNSWFLVFSGKLHDANVSGMVAMMLRLSELLALKRS